MRRLQIDILGYSEVRWPHNVEITVEYYNLYYSGDNPQGNRNGVVIVIKKETAKLVKGIIPLIDGTALMKLNTKSFNTNNIQSYAPTSNSAEDEI